MREAVAAILAAFSFLALGGCAENWAFSHGGLVPSPSSGRTAPESAANPPTIEPSVDGGARTTSAEFPVATPPKTSLMPSQPVCGAPAGLPGNPPITVQGQTPVQPVPIWPFEPFIAAEGMDPAIPGGPPNGLASEGINTIPPNGQARPPEDVAGFQEFMAREGTSILSDYKNYYSWETLRDSSLILAAAAGVANSDLDAEVATWYQTRVRSAESDRISAYWKPFGNGFYTLPACIPLALAYDVNLFDGHPILNVAGDWGDRTTRAFLVGAPPMLAMQEILGASRPDSLDAHSSWRPFSADNGVSGHAFMGSVPFITAAQMTDEPAAKGLLYACSFMTGWSRINDNAHYLSEVCLGWWMGYLACRSVNDTNYAKRQVQVLPMVTPEMSGIGVQVQQ